jgi:translation initiation factor 2 gamma subunit (eIF-2gamma)
MATPRIFNLENKIDGSNTLVRAETKAQVNALIRNSFVITAIGASEVVDMMMSGAKVMDATSLVVGASEGGDDIPVSGDNKDDGAEPHSAAPVDEADRTVP